MKKEKNFKKIYVEFIIYLILAIAVVFIAIFAKEISPKDPLEAIMSDSLKAPSSKYLFGTDVLGRDLLSRVIYGTRYSLFMTLTLVSLVLIVGTFLGLIAGYLGGKVDMVIMRIGDIMVSFPGLILAIAIAGILGPNIINAIIAILSVTWVKYARLSRSLVLKIKNELYIEAAEVIGCKNKDILLKYILPNMFTVMLVTAMSDIGALMLEIAALSFLGFGAQPPIPEWGSMLNEGRTYLSSAPWMMIFPGLAIFIVVIIFNMLGDNLKKIMNIQN